MTDEKGTAGAVKQALDATAPAEIAPPLPLDLIEDGPPAPRRGPGRPEGSRNRVTALMVEYLRRSYADPLEALAQAITQPLDRLARDLKCDRLEAYRLQLAAARDLAPYLYAKVPSNLSLEGQGTFRLVIGEVPDDLAGEDGGDDAFTIEGTAAEMPTDQ